MSDDDSCVTPLHVSGFLGEAMALIVMARARAARGEKGEQRRLSPPAVDPLPHAEHGQLWQPTDARAPVCPEVLSHTAPLIEKKSPDPKAGEVLTPRGRESARQGELFVDSVTGESITLDELRRALIP